MEKFKKLFNKKYSEIIAPDLDINIDNGWFLIVDRLLFNVHRHVIEQHKEAEITRRYFFLKYKYYEICDRNGCLVLLSRNNAGVDIITGMELMSQAWASATCSKCGMMGSFREYSKINRLFHDKTLCNTHHTEEVELLQKKLRNG